jgi:hypothetical protein
MAGLASLRHSFFNIRQISEQASFSFEWDESRSVVTGEVLEILSAKAKSRDFKR